METGFDKMYKIVENDDLPEDKKDRKMKKLTGKIFRNYFVNYMHCTVCRINI